MPDTKISALTAVTTPLTSDVLPIVSGAETKKVSVIDLLSVTIADTDNQTLTITQNDTTNNPNALNVVNTAISTALDVSTTNASGASPLTKPLVSFRATNATYDQWLMELNNTGTKTVLDIQQETALDFHENGLSVVSNVDQTTIDQGFVILWQKGATSTDEVLEVVNDGLGETVLVNTNNDAIGMKLIKDFGDVNQTKNNIISDWDARVTDAGTYTASGANVFIRNKVTETSGTITDSRIVLDVRQEHTDATGDAAYIEHRGTGNNTLSLFSNNGARGLYINQDANSESIYIDSEASSDAALFISGQNTSGSTFYILDEAVHGTGSTGSLMRLQMNNASSTAPVLRLDQNGNGESINIDSEATTANNIYVSSQNTSDSSLYVLSGGVHTSTTFGAVARFQASNASATARTVLAQSGGTGTVVDIEKSGASGTALRIDNDGTGKAQLVDHDDTGTNPSVHIDRDGNNAADIVGLEINVDNAGAGSVIGIDLSSMSTGEANFKFVADATDPTSGGGAATGRIAVDVGGSIVYLPYY